VTVAATLWLLEPLGVTALPIGFAIGTAVKVLLLAASLAIRLRGFGVNGAAASGD
jgi:hypothetical protein